MTVATDPLQLAANTIRCLSMDAVQQADSGHPGMPMGMADVATVLFSQFLRFDPDAPEWPDRDRFVLSAGHGSMLLYSLLHLSGFDLSLDDLRRFRQLHSRTPGHPEVADTPGVETTTGPLGQGFGNAVGMAIAERLLADRFNRPGHQVVDHHTWVFASDGDMMEGVASEAASLAGHLQLGRLTVVYDDNRITIDGETTLTFSEDVGRRFAAYGWQVQQVDDGNDLDAIDRAYAAALAETTRPSLIVLHTVIGDPAPTRKNTAKAHGEPLGRNEVAATKAILGWPEEPFHIPDEALADMRRCVDRGRQVQAEWERRFESFKRAHAELASQFEAAMEGRLPEGWDRDLPEFPAEGGLATRQASQQVLSALVQSIPALAGGSADLAGSTGVNLKHGGSFSASATGRSFHWGVREHAMAAVMNGMAAHGGVRPYGSTFLAFADYMKPSIRLAALMQLPVIYIFTHDSIGLGEDGPTHQPIEHLAMLRVIPNLTVIRPADAAETREAWRVALENRDGPTAIVLTRQKLPILDRAALGGAADARRGGYVLYEPAGGPEAIIIATGSEVPVALAAARKLGSEGVKARVVSLPSWEVFRRQPEAWRNQVLPPGIRSRVSIEAASDFGWLPWVTEDGESIGINRFGASAPGDRLFQEFGFTSERVADAVRRVLAGRPA
ncbi:MAG TPA: transketolase [Gemmatimonadales bacterium]|nr:transketolase [Gemmatimonadales bacterium]